MPLLQYVLIIGSLLFASMIAVDAVSTRPAQVDRVDIDRSVIRIRSLKQPPAPVIIDTSLPTITPPLATIGHAPEQTTYRDAFASVASVRPAEISQPLKRKKSSTRPVQRQEVAVQFFSHSNNPW